MHRTRTMLIASAVALAATACGSGGDDAEPAAAPTTDAPEVAVTTEPPAAEDTAADQVEEREEASTTTEAPETTTTVPAPPPIAALTVDQVTEVPGRFFEAAFTDGSSIIGLARTDSEDFMSSGALVRMDLAGTIVQEAPIDGSTSIFEIMETAGRRFAYGSFGGPEFTYTCGFAEVDTVNLAFGPTLQTSADSSCGGAAVIDDTTPGVIWTTSYGTKDLVRVDTTAGAVTATPLAPLVPVGYELGNVEVLGGNVYVGLSAAYDEVTGGPITAPDGSPLPPMVVRVDGATGTTLVQPLTGYHSVVDGRLIVFVEGEPTQELDPTTLAATDLAEDERAGLSRGVATMGDGAAWTVTSYPGPDITVAQRDPETLRVVAQGTVNPQFTPDSWSNVEPLPIGAELYVVAAQQVWDDATGVTTSVTKLFRTAAAAG